MEIVPKNTLSKAQVVNVDNNGDNVLKQALEQSTKILVLGFDCSA